MLLGTTIVVLITPGQWMRVQRSLAGNKNGRDGFNLRRKGTKRIGVGVGVHGNADVGEDMSEMYVRIDNDGKVVVISGLAEHGTGQSNVVKAVAECCSCR